MRTSYLNDGDSDYEQQSKRVCVTCIANNELNPNSPLICLCCGNTVCGPFNRATHSITNCVSEHSKICSGQVFLDVSSGVVHLTYDDRPRYM